MSMIGVSASRTIGSSNSRISSGTNQRSRPDLEPPPGLLLSCCESLA